MNMWTMKLHRLYFCHGITIFKSISFILSPKSFSPKHLNPFLVSFLFSYFCCYKLILC
jgi:hypothetical protein